MGVLAAILEMIEPSLGPVDAWVSAGTGCERRYGAIADCHL
jgi:hypothetical protein